jgi:hypothetical protein
MGTKRKAPIKTATKKPAAKAKRPALRGHSRKRSEAAVIAALSMRAVEANRLQRRSPALAFGFAGAISCWRAWATISRLSPGPKLPHRHIVLPMVTTTLELPTDPAMPAAPVAAVIEPEAVAPPPSASLQESVPVSTPVASGAPQASVASREDELAIWASVPAAAGVAVRNAPTPDVRSPHAERPQIAIPQQSDVPRPGQLQNRGREAGNDRAAPPAKPSPSAYAALAAANPLIAEARRYLGTNPTGRASLWWAALSSTWCCGRVGYKGGGNLAAAYAKYGTRLAGRKLAPSRSCIARVAAMSASSPASMPTEIP